MRIYISELGFFLNHGYIPNWVFRTMVTNSKDHPGTQRGFGAVCNNCPGLCWVVLEFYREPPVPLLKTESEQFWFRFQIEFDFLFFIKFWFEFHSIPVLKIRPNSKPDPGIPDQIQQLTSG
jgi:hypothetical protein